MKRPIHAAEASAFCAIASRPELAAVIDRANQAIHTAATSGIYGCSLEVNDPENARILQTFFLKLGYAVHVDSNTLSLYWTTLRQ